MINFLEDLTKNIKGSVLPEESMHRHTTWRIGGPAEVLVIPKSPADVVSALQIANRNQKPVWIIGNGSNLLVGDKGVPGLVLKTAGGLTSCALEEHRLVAESGCLLPWLTRQTLEAGLSGLEFAVGIPASLGGALVMNAGAHGGEIAELVDEVKTCNLRGDLYTFNKETCEFGYRKSIFQSGEYIILSATLALKCGDQEESRKITYENLTKRRQAQPIELPSAGSVFRNSPGIPAGKLIDQAGGKGLRVGGAKVAEKHANFIVNTGNATAKDVLTLIQQVQELVYDKFQVRLHPEIKSIGCFQD